MAPWAAISIDAIRHNGAARSGGRAVVAKLPVICELAYEAHSTIQGYEAYRAMTFEYGEHRDQLSPVLRKSIEAGAAVPIARYEEALQLSNGRARRSTNSLKM